ncbi:DUF6603 domain-containing protein [Flavivirga spongiicola]|uniref:DUF6603 domain-containing protein n=1 Tax=Flavivirga spongiicola TaxID=421621 RepID=A0ABU7XR40_9FLAO|nr:DUF6603 domain-containing protein [Flavivirga sp. MEBiC05379]MDO5978249.1 hypothetical protein [Flavivirga sp. MEBiC05379]
MSERAIIPIGQILTDILPNEWVNEINSIIDFIGIDGTISETDWDSEGFSTLQRIIILQNINLEIPFLGGTSLFIGSGSADLPYFDIRLISNPLFKFSIENLHFGIHFPQTVLQAFKKDTEGIWIPEETITGYDLAFTSGFSIDGDGNFDFNISSPETISPARLGTSGVIIDLEDLRIINGSIPVELDQEQIPFDFKGLWIVRATFHFVKEGTNFPPIELYKAGIGTRGFSGTVSLGERSAAEEDLPESILQPLTDETPINIPSHLLALNPEGSSVSEMSVIFQYFGLTFFQSIPVACLITGHLFMPFADKWMKFKASLGGPDSDFMLEIGGASNSPLISLDHEYFEIKADSIAYKVDDRIHYAIISGSIKPKIEGFDWPEIKIEGLSISSEGDISIPGGWIKAPKTITLNFGAFKIGINEIGFGNEGEEPELSRQWLGFSGELNLVEGLDLKASVEGLKFSWLKEPAPAGHPTISAGSKDVQVSLKGIAVEFEIPKTLSFKGSVKYEELTPENNGDTGLTGKLFRGNIDLNLISVRLQIEAELIIGKIKDADGNEFTTFFIVLGAQLPAGIPLGATGTSLYGLKGLGAYNSAPTKTEEQNWYEWYKAEPEREITSMQKWMPKYDNYAFGAGVTIGTMYDDGFTLNMSVMLAILLPGPVIVLEGKANLLKQRTKGQQEAGGPEGAFYLLAVLDGRAGTFMLNVDVKYSLEDVITIGASLEAFFDFNNSSNWYVYLGRKTPETKRIRAEILSLFSANAYFMIDNTSLQTGAGVGFDFRKKYGPVSIVLVAKIGFDATIFWKPMQLEGSLELEASLGIKVFGIGLELYLYMLLEGRVPKPYWIHGVAEVGIKLFWPLPDLSVRVELEWSQPAETPAAWPLLKECSFTHHKGSGTTWPILIGDSTVPTWSDFPIVPIDSRPVFTFSRPINNLGSHENELGVIPIFKTPYDQVGDQQFVYKLDKDSLVLEKYDGSNWEAIKYGINTENKETEFVIERDNIINIQDNLDPNEPQLQLWKYSARDHVNDYGREDYNESKPACNLEPFSKWVTINWQGILDNTKYGSSFNYAGLSFVTDGAIEPIVYREHLAIGNVTINFPNPILYVGILFNDKSGDVKGSAVMNGSKIGDMAGVTNVLIYKSTTHFNSIQLKVARQNLALTNYNRIISITYITKQGAVDQLIVTNNPSPSAARQNMNGKLFLEPAQFYRIKLNTAVDINDRINVHSAENYVYFRTDEGPGVTEVSANPLSIGSALSIPKGVLSHKEKPINILSTYIERTLPIDGALNHYLDYDVGVQFNESYVEKLFKNSIRIQFRDRNGKLLDEQNGDFMVGFLPLFHFGLLSWLSDKQDGSCGNETPSVTQSPYLNFSLEYPFKANSLYSAEMIVDTDLGEYKLHQFQFTSSRYNSFTAHILNDYPENVIDVISLPKVARLRPTFNLGVLTILLNKYFGLVSRFNQEETNLLKKKELFDSIKGLRAKIDANSLKHFNELDEIVLKSLISINMENRPAATKFEVFKIPILNSSDSLVLLESPEPIDWYRITATAKKSSGRAFKIGFVWNEDKTRAFLYRASVPTFEITDYQISFGFSGNKDPLSGVILRKNIIVEELVSFILKLSTP